MEWILAAALRFREQGQEFPYLTINNEPDLCGHGYKIEIDDYVTILKQLGSRFKAEGLATKLVISDGWIPQNSLLYMQAVLADPEARQYVGALAYHAYADGYDDPAMLLGHSATNQPPQAAVAIREQIRDLTAQYNLPVWMTEVCFCTVRSYSDYDLVRARLNHLHDELTVSNIVAFDVMNLFFIRRPGVNDELVEIYFRPDGSLERYEISSYGYMLGHYSRFIPPGSVRLDATSSNELVRVVSFARPDGKAVIIVLNNSTQPVSLKLSLVGLTQTPTALSPLTSSEGTFWQDGSDIKVTNGSAVLVLQPVSITTLVAK